MILWTAALAGGCARFSDADAVKLVRDYNNRVIEAHRRGDATLADAVVGPAEGKKLTGLIGVKTDQGVRLDARLLELRVLAIDRHGGEVVVHTEERWHYRDVKAGTGQQVGRDSTDHYFIDYSLGRPEGRWVVNGIVFARPPVVGRTDVLGVPHGESMMRPDPPGASPPEPGREGTR